jgi:membrane fusion protein, multidrug efflux system
LPGPGLTAKLPANPYSRKPMQPLSCAYDSLSPPAVSKTRRSLTRGAVAGWALFSAVCLLGALAGCSDSNGNASQGQGGKPPMGAQGGPGGRPAGGPGGPGGFGGFGGGGNQPVGVVTSEASMGELGLEIETIGNAVANESAEITSKTVNTVTAIHFTEGQLVRKGMVLVEFDSIQARSELASAEASFAESSAQLKRSRELLKTNVLSQSQIDTLEATNKSNEAKVIAARAKVEDTIIRAPFSGRVGFRRVSVGSLVSPGTVISTLDDTSVVKLDFSVPQSYMFAVQPGLKITAQIAGVANQSFTGKVSTLDSRVDPVTRSIIVRAELPNEKGILKPGMFMTAKISAPASRALLVPEGAIVPEQGKSFVFVVKNGVVSKREVITGRRKPGSVQVTEGLAGGERVVVEGTQKVRDGGQVFEVNSDGTTAVASTTLPKTT